jgi:hypothetical protein
LTTTTISASTISVPQALALLDGDFQAFAAAFDRGEYALWLGSGISRERVAALDGVLGKLLEFVRSRVTPVATCAYRVALDQILHFASLSDVERAKIDLGAEVSTWPGLKSILWRLSQKYSDVLNVTVQGEDEDFLLWVAADFTNTFANQEPDVEHLCVGMLAAEGAVAEIVTANWDGLLESAIKALGYNIDFYRICVRGNDFRGPAAATKLLKFHGCALRAISHEALYRPLLIARASQIVGWNLNNNFAMVRQYMTGVAAQFRTLMVGMSAQDVNIQQIFQGAHNINPWNWADAAPPHVFAEQEVLPGQRLVLQLSYDGDFHPNAAAILKRSLFQAYGKPLLTALVLNTLSNKLCVVLKRVESANLSAADYQTLQTGILNLRNLAAAAVGTTPLVFVQRLFRQLSRAKAILQDGLSPSTANLTYRPISKQPSHLTGEDADLRITGQCEAAVALALIGLGSAEGTWQVTLDNLAEDKGGVVRLTSPTGTVRAIFVANDNVALRLFDGGAYDAADSDVILVHSSSPRARRRRSPSRALGRVGRKSAADIDMQRVLSTASSMADLRERFRQEVGL